MTLLQPLLSWRDSEIGPSHRVPLGSAFKTTSQVKPSFEGEWKLEQPVQPSMWGWGLWDTQESLEPSTWTAEGKPSALCRWQSHFSWAGILFLHFSPVAKAASSLSCLLSQEWHSPLALSGWACGLMIILTILSCSDKALASEVQEAVGAMLGTSSKGRECALILLLFSFLLAAMQIWWPELE